MNASEPTTASIQSDTVDAAADTRSRDDLVAEVTDLKAELRDAYKEIAVILRDGITSKRSLGLARSDHLESLRQAVRDRDTHSAIVRRQMITIDTPNSIITDGKAVDNSQRSPQYSQALAE